MVIGIVGFGLIGRARVAALDRLRAQGVPVERCVVLDPQLPRERRPTLPDWCGWSENRDDLLACGPDWVIIATPHDTAVSLVGDYLASGACVLMEKPMGRNLDEARHLFEQQAAARRLFVGFNYRFFPGFNSLLADVHAGLFGPLASVSMVLGHGGSPGMDQGWKLDPIRAGGGCLLDPGVHLLDLCRMLLPGPIDVVGATAWSGFWNTGIEEEAHVLLRSGAVTVNLQVSVVRWRSTCRIEVHGRDGYGVVTGRDRSYGPQRYVRGRRWGWQDGGTQAESEEVVVDGATEDGFEAELRSLLTGEPVRGISAGTAEEGLAAMELHALSIRASKSIL